MILKLLVLSVLELFTNVSILKSINKMQFYIRIKLRSRIPYEAKYKYFNPTARGCFYAKRHNNAKRAKGALYLLLTKLRIPVKLAARS